MTVAGKMKTNDDDKLTFGGHLEVLRQMLFRILGVTLLFAIALFCLKEELFHIALAPHRADFVMYRWGQRLLDACDIDRQIGDFYVELISTDISSQFMTHVSASVYFGMLLASPYLVYQLFCFVSPALYEEERRLSVWLTVSAYLLFGVGILLNYFVIFPVSFRFLATYQVDEVVRNTITLASYMSMFFTLTLMLGVVFEIPVLAYFMARLGVLSSTLLRRYRRMAVLLIMVLAAVITPPDVFTLIMVSMPLYLLYEVSIHVVERVENKERKKTVPQ